LDNHLFGSMLLVLLPSIFEFLYSVDDVIY
jgi:hypothetical protein